MKLLYAQPYEVWIKIAFEIVVRTMCTGKSKNTSNTKADQ